MTGRTIVRSILVVLAVKDVALAQTPAARQFVPPNVMSVFPPGGTRGQTVDWQIRGSGLLLAKQVTISGSGVKLVELRNVSEAQAIATVMIDRDAAPGFRELRVESPGGISKMVVVRIDRLPQVLEEEPNDRPDKPQSMAIESVIAGTIQRTDLDHYALKAKAGIEVTIDLEARRLGTTMSPVLTLFNSKGIALSQQRETRLPDLDCRVAVKVPADGIVVIQVRDNTYGGGDGAIYRLRATATPFATAVFPRGGPAGGTVKLTASGGSLRPALTKVIQLPDAPGTLIDAGVFEGPGGEEVEISGKIFVGDRNDLTEAEDAQPVRIAIGQAVNGRILRRGEVDRYLLKVKKGNKFRLETIARTLGSAIDTVIVVRNRENLVLAENDDISDGGSGQPVRNIQGLPAAIRESDSRLDFEAKQDEEVAIEVSDRFGDGGPEFAYRLEVGVARNDFDVKVIRSPESGNQGLPGTLFPQGGYFNLLPGKQVTINVTVTPSGAPGPVQLTAEGLPDDVIVEPVTITFPSTSTPSRTASPSRSARLVLKAANAAMPSLKSIQVIGRAQVAAKGKIRRTATAEIVIDGDNNEAAVAQQFSPRRPSVHHLTHFPLRVVGEYRYEFVGPPELPRLESIVSSGVLLIGGKLDLALEFDHSVTNDPDFAFTGQVKAQGLSTNMVLTSPVVGLKGQVVTQGQAIVRIIATTQALPGVYPIGIRYKFTGQDWVGCEAYAIVRAPVEVLCSPGPLLLQPGKTADLWVAVRRQPGVETETEIKVEGLPQGVSVSQALTIAPGDTDGIVRLSLKAGSLPLRTASSLRVIGVTRMPRGLVSAESGNRPMIRHELVEEKGRGRIE